MKKNLIFPLIVSTLFVPSIEAIERTTDLNSFENENNILISDCGGSRGGGGGGVQAKKARKEKQEKAKALFKKRKGLPLTAEEKKILGLGITDGKQTKEITDPKRFKNLNRNQINFIKIKTDSMMKVIVEPYITILRIQQDNQRRKESGDYQSDEFNELLGLSPRSLNFTTAGLDSQKDGNEVRAETYHKLAIKSLQSSLNKNKIDPSEEYHHHGLLAVNYYHVGDFENSNKSLKKAASGYKKPEKRALTKTLIATTAILSGNVNKGCQDLYDYFADGDITLDSTFPIEDFCIFDEQKL